MSDFAPRRMRESVKILHTKGPVIGGTFNIEQHGRKSDPFPYDVSTTEERLIWEATYARWAREDKAAHRAARWGWVARVWESWEFHIILVLLIVVGVIVYAIVEASLLPERMIGRG